MLNLLRYSLSLAFLAFLLFLLFISPTLMTSVSFGTLFVAAALIIYIISQDDSEDENNHFDGTQTIKFRIDK